MFLCTVHLTTLIALERYFYFCHPLKYHSIFNLKTITVICVLIVVLTQGYMIGSEVIDGREFQLVMLVCQHRGDLHNKIQVNNMKWSSVELHKFA